MTILKMTSHWIVVLGVCAVLGLGFCAPCSAQEPVATPSETPQNADLNSGEEPSDAPKIGDSPESSVQNGIAEKSKESGEPKDLSRSEEPSRERPQDVGPGESRDGPPGDRPRDSGRDWERDRRDNRGGPPREGRRPGSGQEDRSFGADIPAGEKKIRISFRNQPWSDVIEFFADQADLSLNMKTYPRGTFNYRDEAYYTPEEAIDLLNGFLLLEEFLLVRKGKMLIVQDLGQGAEGGIPEDLVETIFPEELSKRGAYEVVKVQFDLKRTTPADVQNEIERILSPLGRVAPMQRSQTIQITDTVSNLRAIQKVIEKLDNPVEQLDNLKVVELKNVSADEALVMMRTLMGITSDDQTLRAVSDMSGKKIWLSGRTDQMEKAQDYIRTYDESYEGPKLGELQFKVYTVDSADLSVFLAVCQTLLAGKPGIRLSVDANTNSLLANAYLEDHRTIKAVLEQMQGPEGSTRVEIIRLGKLTTEKASNAIDKFFSSDSKAPVVETDAMNKQLIVRGTGTQILQVRDLLRKMGETGEDWTSGDYSEENRGSIRTINLSPSAAALILDQLREIWPQVHSNDIRITNPSALSPPSAPTHGFQPNRGSFPNGFSPEFTPPQDRRMPPGRNEPSFRNDGETPELSDPRMRELEDNVERQLNELFPGERRRIPERENRDSDRSDLVDDRTTFVPFEGNVFRPVQHRRFMEERSDAEQELPLPSPGEPGLSLEELEYLRGAGSTKGAPITLSFGPTGLMLASDDLEALDALQNLIETMSNEAILTQPVWKPYYLAYVSASSMESMIPRLLGTSSSSSSSDSSAFEDPSAGMIFSVVGSLGSIQATGDVSITSDSRLNVIYVKANPVDHYTIEKKLIPLLDVAQGPEEIKRNATPRLIQLKNMRAEAAMELVKTTFAENMQTNLGGAGNRGGVANFGGQGMPPGMNPEMMQQIMQQMRGGRNAGRSTGSSEEPETMTLSVITDTNQLIVNAPEVLFQKVKVFVETIDEASVDQDMVMEIVPLKNTNVNTMIRSLTNVVGSDKITSSSAATTQRPGGASMVNMSGTGTVISGNTGSTSTGARTGGFGGFGGTGGFGGGGPGSIMSIFGGGARPGAGFGGGTGGGMGGFGGGTTNRPGGGMGGFQPGSTNTFRPQGTNMNRGGR